MTGEFSDDDTRRCAEHGIDIDRLYAEFQLEIRHGKIGGDLLALLAPEAEWQPPPPRKRERVPQPTGTAVKEPGWVPPKRKPRREVKKGELTPWELRVLTLMAAGLESPGLARFCSVTVESVKEATRHARHKLEARNTTHAVAIAIRRGLIEPPPAPINT